MTQRRRDEVSRPLPGDQHDAPFNLSTQEKVTARQAKRAEKAAERREKSEALKEEGNAFFRKGDYQSAIDRYQRAVRVHGRSVKPVLLTNLAMAYYNLGKFPEASEAAEKALEGDPRSVKARYRRGMARKNMEMWHAAAVDWFVDQEDTHDDSEYELPGPEDKPELGESLSESSDCEHAGNGKPCKFYNHAGCRKGRACPYSHAPDYQSERDALGRNVCREYLMGVCSLGERCSYSHSKEFLLQSGWWSIAEEIDKTKKIYEVQQKFQRAYIDFEKSQSTPNPKTDQKPAKNCSRGKKKGPRRACADSEMSRPNAIATAGTRVEVGRSSQLTNSNGKTEYTDDPYSSPEGHHSDDTYEEFGVFGFTSSEVEELLCHGITPWGDATEARDFLEALHKADED